MTLPGLSVLAYYMQFGQISFLLLFISGMVLYLNLKAVQLVVEWRLWNNMEAKQHLKILLKASLAVGSILVVILPLMGLGVEAVTTNPANHIVSDRNNDILMQADHLLFGTHLPFWLQSTTNPLKPFFDSLAYLMTAVYRSLTLVLGILFMLLAFRSTRLFAHMLLTFLLCVVLSLPFWYIFPAVSPVVYLVQDPATIAPAIAETLATYRPVPHLHDFQTAVLAIKAATPSEFLQVTTIPSMHIAWVAAVVYFCWKLHKSLLAFAIPYFILNSLSTMYTLQHYAVDTPAGVALGILAIVVAAFLLHLKSWNTNLTVTEILHHDIQRLKKHLLG